ncbi:MAG: DNRLRE domain-containing protein, partial [Actinobacteria bacterium]|nr:DNRLRE domain-containing protein [Actinomycetota bacterium]
VAVLLTQFGVVDYGFGRASEARAAEGDPIEELISRSTYANVFSLGDGEKRVRISTDPINFRDESGVWRDIDNTLVPEPGGRYANLANEFRVSFAPDGAAPNLAEVEFEGKKVSFGLEGAAPVSPIVSGPDILYPDILPGADLKFEVRAEMLKELLILKERPAAEGQWLDLSFPLSTTGLSPEELTDSLLFENPLGQSVFSIPHMYMYDSSGLGGAEDAFSDNIQLALAPSGSTQTIDVRVDADWLRDPARVYPVTIDPTTINDRRPSLDTFVQSNISNTAQNTSSELKTGYYSGADGTFRAQSLMKFDLADVPQGATINSATLQVFNNHSYNCSAPRQTEVRRVDTSWSSSTTWPNKPTLAGSAASSVSFAHGSTCPNGGQRVDWDVQSIVNYWKSTTAFNHGFALKAANEDDVNNTWRKYASDEATHTPWLDVTFTEVDNTKPGAPSVSSSTHPNETSWYANCSPTFSWSTPSDASGIQGYSYEFNQTSGTMPDNTLDTTTNSYSAGAWPSGNYWMHVRAKDNAGNWSDTAGHLKVNADCSLPASTSISSSSHSADVCSTSNSPSFNWSASDSPSGVEGYGYAFDQASGTVPGTSSVSTTTAQTYSNTADGDWWMHVRAKDRAGNLSGTSHFRVRIDAVPPAAPAITSSSHSDGMWSTQPNLSIGW